MYLPLELKLPEEKPKVELYRDRYGNPKQTLFMVWDEDKEPRPAIYCDNKFYHSTNKKEIKKVLFWAEIPKL